MPYRVRGHSNCSQSTAQMSWKRRNYWNLQCHKGKRTFTHTPIGRGEQFWKLYVIFPILPANWHCPFYSNCFNSLKRDHFRLHRVIKADDSMCWSLSLNTRRCCRRNEKGCVPIGWNRWMWATRFAQSSKKALSNSRKTTKRLWSWLVPVPDWLHSEVCWWRNDCNGIREWSKCSHCSLGVEERNRIFIASERMIHFRLGVAILILISVVRIFRDDLKEMESIRMLRLITAFSRDQAEKM